MTKKPFTVRFTLYFILLNALIWLVFGVIVALGVHPALPTGGLYRWGMALVSFLAAAVLVVLFLMLRRRWKPAWYFAVAALAVSALFTVFDDFGWIDFVVLVLMLIPLGLLILDRKWYHGGETGS